MKKIQAIEILKSLSEAEFRKFEKFAASPYFSKGRNIIPLLKYLKKYHPEYSERKIDAAVIRKKIPELAKASVDVFRMQYSAIENLAKEFLSVNNYLASTHFDLTKLEELSFRGLDGVYKKEMKKTEKTLMINKKNTLSELERIEKIKNAHIEQKGEYTKSLRHVSRIGEYKTTKFIIGFLKNLQDHIVLRNTYMTEMPEDIIENLFEIINLEPVIKLYEGSGYFGKELVIFYYNRIMFYKSGGDRKYYHKIKDIAVNAGDKYGDEAVDLFQNLINCCWWAVKRNMREYERELFEIYNLLLKNNHALLFRTKYMETVQFKNIFILAISIRELDWAEDFIKKYSSLLNPVHGKEIIHHSYAFLYFYQGRYDKSLNEINKVVFKDYVYKMDMQMLTLIIYYETNSFENILYLADSLKHFLNQHYDKFPQSRKNNMLFVKAIVLLVKLRFNFNTNGYTKLQAFIEKEKLLPSRAWFIRKTGELQAHTS